MTDDAAVEAIREVANKARLLDELQAKTTKGNRWVCRSSKHTPRGNRLHEATPGEAAAFGWDTYATAQEAIAAFLEAEKESKP